MDNPFFENVGYLSKPEQERLAAAELDMKLQDTLDALRFRQEKELIEMRRRHNHEKRTAGDLSPQQAADLIDRHEHQYDDLREKHDNECKRHIRENEEAKKILADVQAQDRREAIEQSPDEPKLTR